MVFLFVLMIAVFSFTVVFAADRGFISNKQETAVTADNQKCPIMGYAVNRDINVTLDGKTYYFCCNSCVKKFKDNPSKFINPNFTKAVKTVGEKCFKAGCECVNCSCGQKCECGITKTQNKANCASGITCAPNQANCESATVKNCNKAIKSNAVCPCCNSCGAENLKKSDCGQKVKSGCCADKKMECKSGSCFQDKMKSVPAKMKCGGGSCAK